MCEKETIDTNLEESQSNTKWIRDKYNSHLMKMNMKDRKHKQMRLSRERERGGGGGERERGEPLSSC